MLALHFVSSPLAARLCAPSLLRIFGRARIHFPLSSGHVPRRVGAALPREPLLRRDAAQIFDEMRRGFSEMRPSASPAVRRDPSTRSSTSPAGTLLSRCNG
jgi:hypothetical protein